MPAWRLSVWLQLSEEDKPVNHIVKMTVVVVLIVICGAATSRAIGQEQSAPKIRVISYGGDMAYLLARLPENFGVTIGLETDPKQAKSYVSLHVENPTITDVLNAIVKSAPRYQWRERHGCIEILPVAGSSPFLDTIVSNFQLTDADESAAINDLINLPDVQANLKAMGLRRKDAGTASRETKPEKFSLKLEGETMRQTLCRITTESRGRFWIFQTSGDGLLSISNSPK